MSGADVGAGAGAGAEIGIAGAAAGAGAAGRGAAGCAGDCAAAGCGAGTGAVGAAAGAAGACRTAGSFSADEPHPITTVISKSPRVSSSSFGIVPSSSRGYLVLVISSSSCTGLRPSGRFWPSHMYRRTRRGFCSAGHAPVSSTGQALHPYGVSIKANQMVRQAHHERYPVIWKHPQR